MKDAELSLTGDGKSACTHLKLTELLLCHKQREAAEFIRRLSLLPTVYSPREGKVVYEREISK